jgi:hypothetical protein
LTEDHALKVQLSADQIQTYLACGDIAGALDVDGALIVGMKEPVYAGIAYFVPAADGPTNVSVMIAQVVGDEADGAVSVAATASQATPCRACCNRCLSAARRRQPHQFCDRDAD